MTDNSKDEQLLTQFFDEYAPKTIADDGFSHHVMTQIPKHHVWSLYAIWTTLCTIAIVVYVIFSNSWKLLGYGLMRMGVNIFSYLQAIHWSIFTIAAVYAMFIAVLFGGIYWWIREDSRSSMMYS